MKVILLILLGMVLITAASVQKTGAVPQPQSQGSYWDTPFAKPQYLLHSEKWSYIDATSGATIGPYKEDGWYLSPDQPLDGKIYLSAKDAGDNGAAHYIDKVYGPYYTPGEVCNLNEQSRLRDTKDLWSYDNNILANFYCDSSGPSTNKVLMGHKDVNDTTSKCKPRLAEHLIPDPQYYPDCVYKCEDGYQTDQGKCISCARFCDSKNKNEITDYKESVNGNCACTCDSSAHYNEQGICVCNDGLYNPITPGKSCASCNIECVSRKRNEITDTAKSKNGDCKCTCDTANDYYYDTNGVCVNDLENAMIDAFKDKDREKFKNILVKKYDSSNKKTRILITLFLLELYEGTNPSDLPDEVNDIFMEERVLDRGILENYHKNKNKMIEEG